MIYMYYMLSVSHMLLCIRCRMYLLLHLIDIITGDVLYNTYIKCKEICNASIICIFMTLFKVNCHIHFSFSIKNESWFEISCHSWGIKYTISYICIYIYIYISHTHIMKMYEGCFKKCHQIVLRHYMSCNISWFIDHQIWKK